MRTLLRELGRLRTRLLLVNVLLVLVPAAGLEFAATYEKEMLRALEDDMRNQVVLLRRVLEADLRAGVPIGEARHEAAIVESARHTRTRLRVFGADRALLLDSHRNGPPEGPEPDAPVLFRTASAEESYRSRRFRALVDGPSPPRWPEPARRVEVERAFRGERASYTRVRHRDPGVLLFVAEPVFDGDRVAAVVYASRSTRPVIEQLHRLRRGLTYVMGVAITITVLLTALLAWTISRPLARLSAVARRIAGGERDLPVRVEGTGEIRDLAEAFGEMTDQLRARLRYISDFAADVAHEFKSPLTSIRGAAELLADGAADDAVARERFLSNIKDDSERLDRLVSRLLELSRLESTQAAKSDLDLAELVRRVVAGYAEKGAAVRVDAQDALLVAGRALDVETALRNLVDNALKFSPPDALVEVVVRKGGRDALVTVLDRGPGVPAEDRARVFDRFFTTDEQRKGTGLGLAIVRTVAEAHGGTVSAGDRDGGGAAFTLRLPLR